MTLIRSKESLQVPPWSFQKTDFGDSPMRLLLRSAERNVALTMSNEQTNQFKHPSHIFGRLMELGIPSQGPLVNKKEYTQSHPLVSQTTDLYDSPTLLLLHETEPN